MNGGFEYGNARVRARRADLFARSQYEELVLLDTEQLLARLSESPYRPDLTTAAPRYTGTRALEEALRTNLARTLRELVSWYDDPAATVVTLVVDRWDFRNIRTILRGHYARAAPEDIRAALVPAGRLGDDLLGELADQSGLRPAIELMVSWEVPNRAAARAVAEGLTEFESTADLFSLEAAVDQASADHRDRSLTDADPEVERVLRAEVDQINLLNALRLQRAQSAGEEGDPVLVADRFLGGGSVPVSILHRLTRAPDHAAAIALLDGAPVPVMFQPAFRRWNTSADVVTLGQELDEALIRAATGMFVTADPLGPGIPLAFLWAKENEVANLRTIGSAVAAQIPPEDIWGELVILS